MTKQDMVRRYLAHLGVILCHLSLVGLVLMLGGFFSSLLLVLVVLIGLVLIVLTLGTIFAVVPNYWERFMNAIESTSNIAGGFIEVLPTIGIISVILCAASIVLTAMDLKWKKAKSRLIISSVLLGVIIAVLILIIVNALR